MDVVQVQVLPGVGTVRLTISLHSNRAEHDCSFPGECVSAWRKGRDAGSIFEPKFLQI
jgi:hypothetical protein